MSESTEGQFNSYCAYVVGIKTTTYKNIDEEFNRLYFEDDQAKEYNPYCDLNQLAEVVDELRRKYLWSCQKVGSNVDMIERLNSEWFVLYRNTLIGTSLKDGMLDFVWAAMAIGITFV